MASRNDHVPKSNFLVELQSTAFAHPGMTNILKIWIETYLKEVMVHTGAAKGIRAGLNQCNVYYKCVGESSDIHGSKTLDFNLKLFCRSRKVWHQSCLLLIAFG